MVVKSDKYISLTLLFLIKGQLELGEIKATAYIRLINIIQLVFRLVDV